MQSLNVVYRISDNSFAKDKLAIATKIGCLKNFLKEFGDKNLLVVMDNCHPDSIKKIKKLCGNTVETSLGNAGSFSYAIDWAIKNLKDKDLVYFVEDDYIHANNAKAILLEGLAIADYVSLYDHPDKYIDKKDKGNPYVQFGGEVTRVLLTDSVHWKETNSTTMTFATSAKTLREDVKLWKMFDVGLVNDFQLFEHLTHSKLQVTYSLYNSIKSLFKKKKLKTELPECKKRRLATPIPAYSTHAEVNHLAPLRDWQAYIDVE